MAAPGGCVNDAENLRQACDACKADATDELFCPACGAAVIPQQTKAEIRRAEERERTRHQGMIRGASAIGTLIGACIGLYLFVEYDPPKGATAGRSGWGCFLAFFPFYGAALGRGLGAALSILRARRREASGRR